MGRLVLWLASIYLLFFATIIIYGKLVYGFLSNVHPNQSLTHPPGAYQQYAAYGQFLEISIIVLALLVGVLAALWGLLRKSYLLGIGALLTGIAITTWSYSMLPRIYYLGIDFLPWGLWLAEGLYAYVGAWLIATVIGVIYRKRRGAAI